MQVYFIEQWWLLPEEAHQLPTLWGRSLRIMMKGPCSLPRSDWNGEEIPMAPDILHCHGWMSARVPVYLRTIYQDDPLFHNYKIVYSIYNNEFKTPFRSTFADKLRYDGIDGESLKMIKNPDFVSISKLAVKHSDAVIIGSDNINEELSAYLTTIIQACPILQGRNAVYWCL